MKRSPGIRAAYHGIHVAVIMDGNGRWAAARGMPRTMGHRAGVRTARRIVEAATREGVGTLTLYAFSSDNWSRPTPEVGALMRLLRRSLLIESKRCFENGVRLSVIGRRDRIPAALLRAIQESEALTAHGQRMHLRIAIDYSSRDAMLRAAELLQGRPATRELYGTLLAQTIHDTTQTPDVDLLLRTGGEQRLSDFLLWECAYAELAFINHLWPDFTPADLAEAVRDFRLRDRRFGGLAIAAAR